MKGNKTQTPTRLIGKNLKNESLKRKPAQNAIPTCADIINVNPPLFIQNFAKSLILPQYLQIIVTEKLEKKL